jgi:hypothetical protein
MTRRQIVSHGDTDSLHPGCPLYRMMCYRIRFTRPSRKYRVTLTESPEAPSEAQPRITITACGITACGITAHSLTHTRASSRGCLCFLFNFSFKFLHPLEVCQHRGDEFLRDRERFPTNIRPPLPPHTLPHPLKIETIIKCEMTPFRELRC